MLFLNFEPQRHRDTEKRNIKFCGELFRFPCATLCPVPAVGALGDEVRANTVKFTVNHGENAHLTCTFICTF